jgi:hypothetical protein
MNTDANRTKFYHFCTVPNQWSLIKSTPPLFLQNDPSTKVEITFDPPWDKEMMSEEAQLELGFL